MSDYTLVIGSPDLSSWSLRAWLVLQHFGLPFRELVIELDQPGTEAEIRAHSPAGRVPVLQHGSLAVWESLAIIEYLAERHPRTPAPAPRSAAAEADIARILEIWRGTRAAYGAGGAFLFGGFSAADAMFAPVASRFISYAVPLSAVAAEYRDALWSLPAMRAWRRKAGEAGL